MKTPILCGVIFPILTLAAAPVLATMPPVIDGPHWTAEGDRIDAHFGAVVAAAGDVNGDGYDDLAISAPGFDTGGESDGRAFVYFGSGLSPLPDWTLDHHGAVAPAGDVNGDGYDDLIVRPAVYLGSADGPSSVAGWVAGYGYDDIVVGEQYLREWAWVFYGPDGSTPPTTIQSPEYPYFSANIRPVGDVDGDGYDDLILGPFWSWTGREVHLFRGSPSGVEPTAAWTALDWPDVVSGAGDVNDDGYADVVISDLEYDDGRGGIFLFLGSASGLEPDSTPANADGWAQGDQAGAGFGGWIAAAGDVDANAHGDLVVGASGYDAGQIDEGRAFVFMAGVTDSAPTADAGADERIECTSASGATVTLNGSASTDPDSTPGTNDDIVFFDWYEDHQQPGQSDLGSGEILDVVLPTGEHLVTLVVTDSTERTASDEVLKTVVDETPPAISVELTPTMLWPPNHRMIDVRAAVTATDACGTPTVVLESVTSNEADNGEGDGDTVDDIQDAAIGTADFDLRLRAERAGSGAGRIYTVTYRATDAAGNTAAAAAHVVVPHDRGGITDPIMLRLEATPPGTIVHWTEAPGASSYDVIRGRLGWIAETAAVVDLGPVTCIEAASIDCCTEGCADAAIPDPGQALFYLVQYDDGTSSSYGTESAGKPRAPGPGDCEP